MKSVTLVISDVDGTLVTPEKTLTPEAIGAVLKLRERGIKFTVTSSRPPFGMRMLVEPLGLELPMGAFNGSSIVAPTLDIISHHRIPEAVALKSVALLKQSGVDIWLFTNRQWLLARDNKNDEYVARERHTIASDPTLVSDFSPFASDACKIVGVSADFGKLARCEIEVKQALGEGASAVRSQQYYLDITPAGFDKGTFVDEIAARFQIPRGEIVTIGDMQNDLAMFAKSGLSYAMGNATDEVKAQATCQSSSNKENGFAKAIEDILLRAGRG